MNPADLNFIPNPQFLIEDIENHEKMDLKYSKKNKKKIYEETSSEMEEELDNMERKEEIILKSGEFKFLNSKERKKFICSKCDEFSNVKSLKDGENYCYKHSLKKIFRRGSEDLLTKSEFFKKEYLEKFKLKVEKNRTKIEKVKSELNQSRISTQETNTGNLHHVNLLFKHIFEEIKHLYSCFLDQIGKKISENETSHLNSEKNIETLERDLNIIHEDIERNYEDIVLSMEIEPFEVIMKSYDDKINENTTGIESANTKILEVKTTKIEIKKKFLDEDFKLEKILGNDLFEIVNKILREEGETLTEEPLTERILTSDRNRLKNEKIDDFIITKKISTSNLRKEAEKIIIDLNNVIDQLENQKGGSMPKTPNLKKNKTKKINSKKGGVTSSKKSKMWKNNSKSRNLSLNSKRRSRSDKKKERESYINSSPKNFSQAKLTNLFNKTYKTNTAILKRKLSDVARLENLLKRNNRLDKYGYSKRFLNEKKKSNFSSKGGLFDILKRRNTSGGSNRSNSRYAREKKPGNYEYFRFPQQRNSYSKIQNTTNNNKFNSQSSSSRNVITSNSHYYKNNLLSNKNFFLNNSKRSKDQTALLSRSPDISKSKSRNIGDSRYSSHSYNKSQKHFSFGNKELQTRRFLNEMIKDIEKGSKNPFFCEDKKIGKDNRYFPNWDMFKRNHNG